MTLYRDMTSCELAVLARRWDASMPGPTSRLLYALSERLEEETRRADSHRDRSMESGQRLLEHHGKRTQWVQVAKPHLKLVRRWERREGQEYVTMWACVGKAGVATFGRDPAHAYRLWREHLETPLWYRNKR